MEQKSSLQRLQVPVTCPYPESDQFSPCPISLPKDPPEYYPLIYVWVYQVVSFPQVTPPKPRMYLSPPPYVLHAPYNSFSV